MALKVGDKVELLQDVYGQKSKKVPYQPNNPKSKKLLGKKGTVWVVDAVVSESCVQAHPFNKQGDKQVFVVGEFVAMPSKELAEVD